MSYCKINITNNTFENLEQFHLDISTYKKQYEWIQHAIEAANIKTLDTCSHIEDLSEHNKRVVINHCNMRNIRNVDKDIVELDITYDQLCNEDIKRINNFKKCKKLTIMINEPTHEVINFNLHNIEQLYISLNVERDFEDNVHQEISIDCDNLVSLIILNCDVVFMKARKLESLTTFKSDLCLDKCCKNIRKLSLMYTHVTVVNDHEDDYLNDNHDYCGNNDLNNNNNYLCDSSKLHANPDNKINNKSQYSNNIYLNKLSEIHLEAVSTHKSTAFHISNFISLSIQKHVHNTHFVVHNNPTNMNLNIDNIDTLKRVLNINYKDCKFLTLKLSEFQFHDVVLFKYVTYLRVKCSKLRYNGKLDFNTIEALKYIKIEGCRGIVDDIVKLCNDIDNTGINFTINDFDHKKCMNKDIANKIVCGCYIMSLDW